jgi:hypothetical protein
VNYGPAHRQMSSIPLDFCKKARTPKRLPRRPVLSYKNARQRGPCVGAGAAGCDALPPELAGAVGCGCAGADPVVVGVFGWLPACSVRLYSIANPRATKMTTIMTATPVHIVPELLLGSVSRGAGEPISDGRRESEWRGSVCRGSDIGSSSMIESMAGSQLLIGDNVPCRAGGFRVITNARIAAQLSRAGFVP